MIHSYLDLENVKIGWQKFQSTGRFKMARNWRSEVTGVDAELKEDQTFSIKDFLKLKYRSLSQYVSLSGSFAINSAVTVNCNLIYRK